MSYVTQLLRSPYHKSQILQIKNTLNKNILAYYKLGQNCVTGWCSIVQLQIGENFLSNLGISVVLNWGKFYSKLRHLLQIRANGFTKWGSYYKLGQLLQIGR